MIPKIGHFVWNHKNILYDSHPLVTNGIINAIRLNPSWEFTVYTPPEIEYDLKNILTTDDYELIRNRHFVSKIDLWRLFKMYFEGGFYMDIDKMVNKPFHTIFNDNIKWVIPITLEYDFSCDVMISEPFNPAFKTAFEMYLNRVNNGQTDQYFLGPQTYMHAVSYTLCGELVNTDPGPEKFKMLREKISEMPFALTYREVPHNDMLLYQGTEGDNLEIIKRDFYAKEGIKHWTGDW